MAGESLGVCAYSVKARMPNLSPYHQDMSKNKSLSEILAENVRAAMTQKKLSQPAVSANAKKSGFRINQTTVGRIARAESPATIDTLEALSRGVDAHAWQLLIPGALDENLLAVLKAWSETSAQGRELLVIAAEGAMHYARQSKERAE